MKSSTLGSINFSWSMEEGLAVLHDSLFPFRKPMKYTRDSLRLALENVKATRKAYNTQRAWERESSKFSQGLAIMNQVAHELVSILDEYRKNEEINDHASNLVLLAKHFGTEYDQITAETNKRLRDSDLSTVLERARIAGEVSEIQSRCWATFVSRCEKANVNIN